MVTLHSVAATGTNTTSVIADFDKQVQARSADAICRGFQDTPFLTCFTFGEQGNLLGRSQHGNLMISAIAFGR
jgi:hypothetical protein